MCLLFLLLMGFEEPVKQLTIPDMFTPLFGRTLTVVEDRLWVADSMETRVHIFDLDGNLIKSFGRKGQGPGEFNFILDVDSLGKEVYLVDFQKIHIFDKEGNSVKTLPVAMGQREFYRVDGGWVYQKINPRDPSTKHQVFWADEQLENEKLIAAFNNGATETSAGGMFDFNPAPERTLSLGYPDGKHIVVREPGTKVKLKIIDIVQNKTVAEIEKEVPLIPYDEEDGDRYYERRMKVMAKSPFKREFKKAYPENYPSVSILRYYGDGNLYAYRSSSSKAVQRPPIMCFDAVTGEEKEAPFKDKTIGRILGYHDGIYLISTYDPETENPGIAFCSKDQVEPFVAANPIKYGDDEDEDENDE